MSNNGEYAGRLSERGEVLVAEAHENHLVGQRLVAPTLIETI
jgi:hypothetical protein